MTERMNDRLNELRKFQSEISKKIFKKFGFDDLKSSNGWGWFVDPELTYNYDIFNKNKYPKNVYASNHVSIPETIKEYPTIRSIKSINNFHDKSIIDIEIKDKTIKTDFNYVNVVGVVTLVSLIYVLIVL